MARSLWKGPNFNAKLNNKITTKAKRKTMIYAKNVVISEECCDKKFKLYVGFHNIKFTTSSHKIGYKLGQFAITRTFTWKEPEKKPQKKNAKKK